MNIVLTGAAGNITRPLAKKLLAAGHAVTVIGRNAENLHPLVDGGATPAVGSIEDEAFLTEAFRGADAVYTMVPVPFHRINWVAYHETAGRNYAKAIWANAVPKVVNLSTYGAHRSEGIGPTAALNRVETALNALENTTVIHLRPGFFYSNLVQQIPSIRNAGIIGGNYGNPDHRLILVHPKDIADVAVEALTNPDFNGREPYYVVSDARPYADIAAVIGKAIGKDGLPWVQFSDDDLRGGMKQGGYPDGIVDIYIEIGQDLERGIAQEHYDALPVKPALGRVKLEDYAREFAAVYAQSN